MKLSSLGAPELSALMDEQVIPMACQLAYTFRHQDPDTLARQVAEMADGLADAKDKSDPLLFLVAAGLVALAAIPGGPVLFQAPDDTRSVRVSEDEYKAFREGQLRHVVVRGGTFNPPRTAEVIVLLERGAAGLTGRDALAEALYVSTAGVDRERKPLYVVSVRPWRGLGTDGPAQMVLDERQNLIREVAVAAAKLHGSPALGELERKVLAAMVRTLQRLSDLCGAPRPHPAAQTSTRTSSGPSGHDGKVIAPPANVATNQMR